MREPELGAAYIVGFAGERLEHAVVRPAIARLELLRADHDPRRALAADTPTSIMFIRQASKPEHVELAAGLPLDLGEHLLQLDVVEEVLRRVVEGDGAIVSRLRDGGAEQRAAMAAGRARGARGCAAPLPRRRRRAAPPSRRGAGARVDVGVVDAAAVVPDHAEQALGRILLDRPAEEVDRRPAGSPVLVSPSSCDDVGVEHRRSA